MNKILVSVLGVFGSATIVWLLWDWVIQGMFPTLPDMGYWYALGARLFVWNLIGLDSFARYLNTTE